MIDTGRRLSGGTELGLDGAGLLSDASGLLGLGLGFERVPQIQGAVQVQEIEQAHSVKVRPGDGAPRVRERAEQKPVEVLRDRYVDCVGVSLARLPAGFPIVCRSLISEPSDKKSAKFTRRHSISQRVRCE
jgi:hypothetical protein